MRLKARIFIFSLLWLIGLIFGATSCATNPTTAAALPRFHGGSDADVVLRFSSWNSIFITQPDTRRDGFLPLYNREQVAVALGELSAPRNLAVVLLSEFYSNAQAVELAQDWRPLLFDRGFKRFVLLRGSTLNIDGLPVLYDSATTAADDTTAQALALAALAPAARTDAPHPSSAASR